MLPPLFNAISAWIDAGWNPDDDPATLTRVRVMHATSILFNCSYPVFLAQALHLGMYRQAVFVTLNTLVANTALLRLVRRGRPALGGHVLTAGMLLTVLLSLANAGGIDTNTSMWLLLVPVAAGLFVGPNAALPWAAAAYAGVCGYWLATSSGVTFVDPLSPEARRIQTLFDFGLLLAIMAGTIRLFGGVEQGMRDELSVANDALRDEVTERSAAEREAASAAAARSVFLATMSHEIRTPLHGLLGLTDLLRRSNLDADQRECVEAAHESSKLLHRLLDDILDFSKIDAGQLELESIPVDLTDMLRGVESVWSRLAAERGIRLEVDVGPGGWVHGDPTRLRQILGNLVSNALKFTEEGSIHIALTIQGDTLQIRVRDTGIGMNADATAKVFDAFRQADSTTTRQYGGTGLGLAICRAATHAMGGQITVESIEHVGTTFTLTLPHRPARPDKPQGSQQVLEIPEGRRVLVAEDNPVNQMLVRRILESMGLEVEIVGDGEACVASWEQAPPDLILMDCNMPRMDGYEATRRIRQLGGTLPIVALTANSMEEDVQRCFQVGMNACLCKPARRETLEHTLAVWLHGGPQEELVTS